MGVHQFVFPGVITLADGQFEAVLLYLYVKGLREGGSTTFRGFLFAQSVERAWYNWGETGLCQPYVAKAWLPRIYLRCAPRAAAGCGARAGAPARPGGALSGGALSGGARGAAGRCGARAPGPRSGSMTSASSKSSCLARRARRPGRALGHRIAA